MTRRLLAFTMLLIGVSNAEAATIHDQQYAYKYGDTVTSVQEDAFVVCEKCSPDRMVKAPKQPFVAIKLNPIEPEPVQVASDEPAAAPVAPTSSKEEQLLGTVKFTFDSDKIGKKERQKLKRLAAAIPANRKVTVIGYTCDIGKKKHNKALSKRRAQNVATYLKHEGTQVSKVEGRGAAHPVSKEKRLNRRVEVKERENN